MHALQYISGRGINDQVGSNVHGDSNIGVCLCSRWFYVGYMYMIPETIPPSAGIKISWHYFILIK